VEQLEQRAIPGVFLANPGSSLQPLPQNDEVLPLPKDAGRFMPDIERISSPT